MTDQTNSSSETFGDARSKQLTLGGVVTYYRKGDLYGARYSRPDLDGNEVAFWMERDSLDWVRSKFFRLVDLVLLNTTGLPGIVNAAVLGFKPVTLSEPKPMREPDADTDAIRAEAVAAFEELSDAG